MRRRWCRRSASSSASSRGRVKSGKTVALTSLCRGVFYRIYIFSPSINVDDGWIPVKKYIEEDLGVNAEREQAYWEDWDEPALRRIIQQQRKITETSKKLEMKKLYQVLIILDPLTAHADQHLGLISAAVRVNQQFICCWRLRNQHELDAVVKKLSALLPETRAGDPRTLQLPVRVLPKTKERNVLQALQRAFCN